MIAFLTLELHIEAAQSLKDKRQVVRSLKDRLRGSFNVSVAELESSPVWNRATIGVVSISDSRDYLDGLMKNVERQATRIANNHGADVADSFVEYLEVPEPSLIVGRLSFAKSCAEGFCQRLTANHQRRVPSIALLPLYLPGPLLCARQ